MRNVETNPCGTYGNCKVQEPSKGSDGLAKHERSDRRNDLKRSNLLTVSHIQCTKRAHDITRSPGIPCQVVAADLYQIDDEHYLIVVEDYHSRYFELEKMSSTTCPALISRIKAIFARFRITEKVVSDNGPQFAGA